MNQPMTPDQFDFIAKKIRSKEPAITAARMVLVGGSSVSAAVEATGIKQPSLSRSLKSYREFHADAQKLYGPHEGKGK